jgi:homoaconitase/3-isopropylmalate dehydratase large subunit
MRPRAVIEKIWADHVVASVSADEDRPFIDRMLMHERTGPQLLEGLRRRAASRPPRAWTSAWWTWGRVRPSETVLRA